MIRLFYKRGKGKHELTINGHAGYAEYGHDIVCSGVSAITFALLAWIEHNEDEITQLDELVVEDGRVYISCAGTKNLNTAFQVALMGYIQIARAHPDYVSIGYDRDRR